jgi:hypothetical protein
MGEESEEALESYIATLPGWELLEPPITIPKGETWEVHGWILCADGLVRLMVKTGREEPTDGHNS